jgi:hypothetical protein
MVLFLTTKSSVCSHVREEELPNHDKMLFSSFNLPDKRSEVHLYPISLCFVRSMDRSFGQTITLHKNNYALTMLINLQIIMNDRIKGSIE